MLTSLEIENFKSHLSTQVSLGNLTLLTGVNSSGKSSLIQALLLLRQSFLKERLMNGLDLNDPLCRIGTGQDALNRVAKQGVLCIRLGTGDGKRFGFEFDVDQSLSGTFLPKKSYTETVVRGELEKLSVFSGEFQYVSSLRTGGRSHFERYDYEVGQLRQISRSLGQGECVAHYLHQFGADPTTNYLFDGKEYALADQVQAWEKRLSAGVTIDAQKGETGGFDILYGYAMDGEKPVIGLKAENVGYGLSSALPVLVALLSAKPGALVILENPEAHLHPAGQAELAKLISRVAQNGVQVIVETHSDHIVNGVLVAAKQHENPDPTVRQKGIDRLLVRIYYVDKDPDRRLCARVRPIAVEEGGRLDRELKGFFDQAEHDLYYLMRGDDDGRD